MAKKQRRGNGEGSIYKRGDTWVGQYTIGRKTDGKMKLGYVYGKSRAEVNEKMNQKQNDVNKGIHVDSKNMTASDWVYEFLETYKRNTVTEDTYAIYLAYMKNHIDDTIGYYYLNEITNIKVQNLYNKLANKNMSAQAIKKIHDIINPAFKKAVFLNLMQKNPCDYTIRPKIPRPKLNVLSYEQQVKLMDSLDPTIMEDVCILVAMSTGLRIGEILALSWDTIDFKKMQISVSKSVKRNTLVEPDENGNRSALVLKEPKTISSIRTVPISNNLHGILLTYKDTYDNTLPPELAKQYSNRLFYSFNHPEGLSDTSRFVTRFKAKLKENGIPEIRFHDLRHSFTTRLMESKVHPKIASTILGHSSAKITLDIYTHVSEDQQLDAINTVKGI